MAHEIKPALAAVGYEPGVDINRLLRDVVARVRAEGTQVGGLLQEKVLDSEDCCEQLNLVDIRSGEAARITQQRGKEARGCKLDPRGLADIAHCIQDAIDADVELIVINKFGRAESEGGGLLSCFGDAVMAGIPLLTTAREPYLEAWRAFHGGLGIELPCSLDAVCDWFNNARAAAIRGRVRDGTPVDETSAGRRAALRR
jgi:nucleoside-triphosphatase THEP1